MKSSNSRVIMGDSGDGGEDNPKPSKKMAKERTKENDQRLDEGSLQRDEVHVQEQIIDDKENMASFASSGVNVVEHAQRNGYINFTPAAGETLVQCPYVQAHTILSARFAKHLVKCRKNYQKEKNRLGKEVEMAICRFNYKHHVPKMEMDYHEAHCEGSASVVEFIQNFQESTDYKYNLNGDRVLKKGEEEDMDIPETCAAASSNGTSVAGSINGSCDYDDEEDWDAEAAENIKKGRFSYDPRQKLKAGQGKIIQSLPGITTKSERETFRRTQAEAFERRGAFFDEETTQHEEDEDSVGSSAPDSRVPGPASAFEMRSKRASAIANARTNAARMEEHYTPENRKKRNNQALEQMEKIISLARDEQESVTSDDTLTSYSSHLDE